MDTQIEVNLTKKRKLVVTSVIDVFDCTDNAKNQPNQVDTLHDVKHIILYYADWCEYCKLLMKPIYKNHLNPVWPKLKEMYKSNPNVIIEEINEINMTEFSVPGFPTIIMKHKGKEKEYLNSDRNLSKLVEFIETGCESD